MAVKISIIIMIFFTKKIINDKESILRSKMVVLE